MINYCHATSSPFANERDEQMQHQILQSFRIWRITIARFLRGMPTCKLVGKGEEFENNLRPQVLEHSIIASLNLPSSKII